MHVGNQTEALGTHCCYSEVSADAAACTSAIMDADDWLVWILTATIGACQPCCGPHAFLGSPVLLVPEAASWWEI